MADAEGGFDCEFVEKPPKAVQSECPVCLLVLKELYQATCCGYGFCRVCIEQVRAGNKPCPCCKADKFESFEDKGRKRLLNEYQVHCTNKKLDCQWVGELGELENHLNSNPPQDKLEGCQFTRVRCLHCLQPIQRSDVAVHQNDQCQTRPFACEYCKDHDSTYEDVTTNHWPVCGGYPVLCPNKCIDETMERQNLESHIANDCPLTVVDCDFKGVGCEVRLPRKDLATHLKESFAVHVSLQTKQLMDVKKENKQLKQQVHLLMEGLTPHMSTQSKRLVDLENENKELKQKVEKLTEDIKAHYISQSLDHSTISGLQKEAEKLKKDLNAYEIDTPLCPVEIIMKKFEEHKKDGEDWHSPPFYTHPKGYKMCLRVYAGGNGNGANTHVSVYFTLMKGEYDDQLKWPFQGKFTIQLLSQNGDENHRSGTVTFDADTPDIYCNRVVDGERCQYGWGRPTFIAHTKLKPRYLQNDCLKFYIKVED